MNKRLHEQFVLHQPVEIFFDQINRWVSGRVAAFDHPGLWVETAAGQRWFVTNQRRIRPWQPPMEDDESA